MLSLFRKLGIKMSLNDHQWGRNPQDDKKNEDQQKDNQGNKQPNSNNDTNGAPPDLDRLWQDFNQRISKLLGQKKKGGGNNNNNGGNQGGGDLNRHLPKLGFIGVVVAIFLWLISGFFIIQEGQVGVVTTFGKYAYTQNPGFNWRWPAPIQHSEVVNVSQIRTIEVGYRSNVNNKQLKEALMLTDDENIIDIQFAVQYRIKDAAAWLFNNADQENMVRQVAETAIREVVGKSKMDYVLYEGREQVALNTNQLMQQILDKYTSGVQVSNVTMQAVQPPEQVQAAFDDAVKAGQDRERLKNEGEAYANDVIPRARGAASRLMEEADAYRSSVVANAEGDADRFKQVLSSYEKAPAVTRERMYLETMQQIFENTTKVMVDSKAGNNLLYLPLDKIIQQTGGTAPAATSANPAGVSGVASKPATTADTSKSLDASRDTYNTNERVRDVRSREVR